MLKMILLLFSLLVSSAYANQALPPLAPDQAFALSAELKQNNVLRLHWQIAPGYYLYRDQIHLAPQSNSQIKLGKIKLPQGQKQQDLLHGLYQAYAHSLTLNVPFNAPGTLNIIIGYQGCSAGGFCYAPIQKTLRVDLAKLSPPIALTQYLAAEHAPEPSNPFFAQHNFFMIILSFLGLGLLLAFTPCVLPMIPILSSIIVGQHKKTASTKALFLSLSYVGGSAITYAVLGIVIALLGRNIQAELQQPWVILSVSGIFVLLALALFGLYELRLPRKWQQKITSLSQRQRGGSYLSVFCMGCLSTLIVSPCVSAPLVGVLAYIGQTGDLWLGALALLALGIGMGIPLVLIGMSADRLLPKAGPWMMQLERIFGLLMLGLAIWMLSRLLPGPVTLALWASLAIFAAFFLDIFAKRPWLAKLFSAILLGYGILLFVGATQGNSDPTYPWKKLPYFMQPQTNAKELPFVAIHSTLELKQQLAQAQLANKPVMLDFYADWCAACVAMERNVFTAAKVQQALAPFVLLRADVTHNTSQAQALQKYFQIVGPPAIIFFSPASQELTSLRIIGEVNIKEFLTRLTAVQETH